MLAPILYGAPYSVYVRAARMALAEKRVAYSLVEVDVFAPGGPPADHLARQPFGKIPVFEHEGFQIYETAAITRYVDEAFDGPPLQPTGPKERARMSQMLGIMDGHVYPDLVWGLYVPRSEEIRTGRRLAEAELAQKRARAETCLKALESLAGDGPWLVGSALTLADLHAAPMFALFLRTPEGADLLPRHTRLTAWWSAIVARESFVTTSA
jgi:glutathione S-transferase